MGIGVLKEVQVTLLCGMRSIDVSNDTLNILGTHVSCNKKLKKENTVTSIQRVLKKQKMRNFIREGKTVVFKTMAISKTVFQSFIRTVSKYIVNDLEIIKKTFFMEKLYS